MLRGGTPTAYDRVLATRFGVEAIDAVHEGDFGKMVALRYRLCGADRRGVADRDAIEERSTAASIFRRVLRRAPSTLVLFGLPRRSAWHVRWETDRSTISIDRSLDLEPLEVNLLPRR